MPYPLRMPAELRTRLETRARENGRSANSEIIAMLTTMLESKAPALASVPAAVLLEEVLMRYGARLQIVIAKDVAENAGIVALPNEK
jgi:plasmid stability protein